MAIDVTNSIFYSILNSSVQSSLSSDQYVISILMYLAFIFQKHRNLCYFSFDCVPFFMFGISAFLWIQITDYCSRVGILIAMFLNMFVIDDFLKHFKVYKKGKYYKKFRIKKHR